MINDRPTELGEVFGQDHILPTLIDWIDHPTNVPSSVLLHGPYGVGKTTVARILAKTLCSETADVMEINAASSRGVDDARAWAEAVRIRPYGTARAFILDELHQMTQDAQKVLLKVIEEPPQGVYFFLCTTNPSQLLNMIQSRCTPLAFRLFDLQATKSLLQYVFKGDVQPEVAEAIHSRCGGHARDAVKIAKVIVKSGVYDEVQLNAQFGLSFQQAATMFDQYVKGVSTREQVLPTLLALDGQRSAGDLLDSWVDHYNAQGHKQCIDHYVEFLQVRAMRKEYKIGIKEQLLHLFSRVKS